MEDKYMPSGWHWKITPEQIEKIKERDLDTVNQVYFDNLDKFKAMAYNFCYSREVSYCFEDCVQQVYVDLLDYDFSNSKRLFWSIRNSFYRACPPLLSGTVSLFTPIKGADDIALMDCIEALDEVDAEQRKQEQERHVLAIIAEQKQLNDKDKDILTAYALNCLCYRGLFAYEYTKAFAAQY